MKFSVKKTCKTLFLLCILLMVGILFPVASHGKDGQKKGTLRFKTGLYYTIQKGDTVYSIARMFGKTVAEIVDDNKIKDVTNLQIGQKILV